MAERDLNREADLTLDEIEPEAREAAKMAARKAGLPVGVWLSQTILKVATEELKHRRNGTATHATQTGFDAGQAASGNGSGPLPPAPTHEMVLESIQRLAGRIEEAEQHTAETLRPLAEKLSMLSRRVEEVSSRGSVSTAPMERALMRLTERLERLESDKAGKDGGRRRFFSR